MKDVPQGSNQLTIAIEDFMKEWGGTKYQKATLQELQDSLYNRINPIIKDGQGAIRALAAGLKRRTKTKATKEEFLLETNETLFKFFEGEQ